MRRAALSRHRTIVWFGIANLGAVAAIAVVQGEGLTSIWCSWAAIVSVLIFFQLVAWRNAGRNDADADADEAHPSWRDETAHLAAEPRQNGRRGQRAETSR